MSDDDALNGVHAVTMADIPFEAIREHWRSLSTWPPHMAVAWVAEPTWEEIVAQSRRQTGAPRMREASEAVLAALTTGKMIAYGMRTDKRMGWAPPVRITPEEWESLIWIGGTLSTAALNKHTGIEAFRDVQFDRIGLFRLWPDSEAIKTRPTPASVPKVRRGRGAPITKTFDVEARMRDYIRNGGKIEPLKGIFLAEQFGASEGTCRPAWDRICAEFRRGNY